MTSTLDDNMVEDFLSGDFLPKFEDGETRTLEFLRYEFDDAMKGYGDGKPTRGIRFYVKDLQSPVKSEKKWEIKSRIQAKIILTELKNGPEGKPWSVMAITREGLGQKTTYKAKGVR
jgi:aspartyl-tRNA synthetase